MSNKKTTIGIATLAAVVVSLGLATSAFAYQGNPSTEGPNHTPERHEAMEKAFDTSDYSAWESLMSDKGRVTEVINEGNFNKFAEAHRLAENGDFTGANEIKAELGLGQGNKNHGMRGDGNKGEGKRMNNSGTRGQNSSGNFVDINGDGTCDNL